LITRAANNQHHAEPPENHRDQPDIWVAITTKGLRAFCDAMAIAKHGRLLYCDMMSRKAAIEGTKK
jgi:hypothetical protein